MRGWVRLLAVLQSVGWIALEFTEDEGLFTLVELAVFVAVPPFLALFPVVKLQADGDLLLRGWTSRRLANAAQVRRLAMTQYGLQLRFDDGTRYTTVIFQATRSFGRPRVLEFADALRRAPRGSKSFDPLDLFRQREIEIYNRDDFAD